MKTTVQTAALTAGILILGIGITEAAKGPKKPERPFVLYLFTASEDQDTVDSTNDVRKAVAEKKADWFRLTEDRSAADIVLEITGRSWTSQSENVVYGRVSSANLDGAKIIGQAIPGILDLHKGAWRSAAENMATRLERFCRDTYAELAAAQQKRRATSAGARQ